MVVIFLILGGCIVTRSEEMWDYQFEHDIIVNDLREAYSWVICNVCYKDDVEGNYWQSPEETYKCKTGDCEDLSIMFMYLAHCTGINPELCLVNTFDMLGHAIVRIDNYYYDPSCEFDGWEISLNFVWYSEPYAVLNYGETMWRAYTKSY